jgi:hypothetical protein
MKLTPTQRAVVTTARRFSIISLIFAILGAASTGASAGLSLADITYHGSFFGCLFGGSGLLTCVRSEWHLIQEYSHPIFHYAIVGGVRGLFVGLIAALGGTNFRPWVGAGAPLVKPALLDVHKLTRALAGHDDPFIPHEYRQFWNHTARFSFLSLLTAIATAALMGAITGLNRADFQHHTGTALQIILAYLDPILHEAIVGGWRGLFVGLTASFSGTLLPRGVSELAPLVKPAFLTINELYKAAWKGQEGPLIPHE